MRERRKIIRTGFDGRRLDIDCRIGMVRFDNTHVIE